MRPCVTSCDPSLRLVCEREREESRRRFLDCEARPPSPCVSTHSVSKRSSYSACFVWRLQRARASERSDSRCGEGRATEFSVPVWLGLSRRKTLTIEDALTGPGDSAHFTISGWRLYEVPTFGSSYASTERPGLALEQPRQSRHAHDRGACRDCFRVA